MDDFENKIKKIPSLDGFKDRFSEKVYMECAYFLRRFDIPDNKIIEILSKLYISSKMDISK